MRPHALLTALLLLVPVSAAAQSHTTPVIEIAQKDWVNSVAFSPDGKLLAVGVLGRVSLLSCPGGQPLGQGEFHTKYVQGLAFSPDGESLYSIGWDGMLCLWRIDGSGRLASRPLRKKALAASRPQVLAVFPDGTRVVTNGSGDDLEVFDAETLTQVAVLSGLKSTPTSVVADPSGNRLVGGDKKGNLAVWSLSGGELLKVWDGHGGRIVGLATDRIAGDLISCDDDGELKKWDSASFKETKKKKFDEGLRGLQVSRDGRFAHVALKTGEIRLFDGDFEPAAGSLTVSGRPNSLALDARGRYLACGTDRNELFVWDLLNIREVQVAYDMPARLEIDVDFDDTGALIPNRALDGGEKVKLSCRVRNVGDGTAYDTRLNVSCDNPSIVLPAPIPLGDLLPGAERAVTVPMEVDLEARDGAAQFTLHVAERKQNDARAALGLSVRFLPKPDLVVTGIQLDDRNAGSTAGNGNGTPENGETVELEIFLRNQGQGPAWRNRIELTQLTPGVEAVVRAVDLPPIPAGGAASGRLRMQIPKTFAGGSLQMQARITDAVTGHEITAQESWGARQNLPVLAADWRVIQDLRNGRAARIQMSVLNRGTLAAENLRVTVGNDRRLPLRQTVDRIPRVEAGGEDSRVVIELDIPRDFAAEQITLDANITQDNFEAVPFTQTLPVELVRPELQVRGLPDEMELVHGGELYLDLLLENVGQLDAEDVEIVISAPELKLHEVQTLERVPGGGQVQRLAPVRCLVRTGVDPGPTDLTLQITQRDFDPVRITRRPVVREARIASKTIEATTPSGGALLPGSTTGSVSNRNAGTGGDVLLNYGNLRPVVRDPYYELEILVNAPQGIRGLTGFVNGLQIYNLDSEPDDLTRLQSMRGQFLNTRVRLSGLLADQVNDIEFRVIGQDGNLHSFPESVRYETVGFDIVEGLDMSVDVNLPPKTGRRNPNAVALLIGVSDYMHDSMYDVEFARQDVLAVKQTLINTLGYEERNIITLLDSQANYSGIHSALTVKLHKKMTKLDRPEVFVYFSGHGAAATIGGQRGYLLPWEAEPGEEMIVAQGYPIDRFNAAIGELDASRITVAIDACFSGRSASGPLLGGGRVAGISAEGPVSGRDNCVVFSASDGDQTSWTLENKKHGLFTYYFLLGLQGEAVGDGSRQGKNRITAQDLQDYLDQHVPVASLDLNQVQTPKLDGLPSVVIAD